MNEEAWEIKVFGVVQGVGFRPFVHRLAEKYQMNGFALNSSVGLTIVVEGHVKNFEKFIEDLTNNPPKLAQIDKCKIIKKNFIGYKKFSICLSESDSQINTILPPDTGICTNCLKEFFDKTNHRYQYLMNSCTECGPRFSIAHVMPYDRENTSMNTFAMCPRCKQEYECLDDRRYHTEAISCPACGPKVWLSNYQGEKILIPVTDLLKSGQIIAVKGIGGFHLACDALNEDAVNQLRNRKKRDSKPFAVMCKDLNVVKDYCEIDKTEMELLLSNAKPIVLLTRKLTKYLPDNISPGIYSLGVMLPYTPIHYSLFNDGIEMIVLTSANISNEPLIKDNREAVEKLKDVANYFLLHDRQIVNSCDDSVVSVVNLESVIQRRSRGYVPLPIKIKKECKSVLACGGDNKNTFCLLSGHEAFMSQHLGDLSYYQNYQRYLQTIDYFKTLTGIRPEIIAYDLHPGYMSTQYAKKFEKIFAVPVQHHHAHMVSCMVENEIDEVVLGVICDGTGYGTDDCLWGFEFFYGNYSDFERLAHLEYLPLIGGDQSIYQPLRIAFSYLYFLFGDIMKEKVGKYLPQLTNLEIQTMQVQLENNIGIVNTSSCGRLFDAVAAFLDVCTKVNYEGQAAILLEALSQINGSQKYSYELVGSSYPYQLKVKQMFGEMLWDKQNSIAKEIIGGKFHSTVIDMIVSTTLRLSQEKHCQKVSLSGGVFQNKLLLKNIVNKLKNNGLQVYIQHKVPSNDGGLALGQALIGEEVFKRVSSGNWKNCRN